jgi:hypothetical protein
MVRWTALTAETSDVRLPQHFGRTVMTRKIIYRSRFDHLPSTLYGEGQNLIEGHAKSH